METSVGASELASLFPCQVGDCGKKYDNSFALADHLLKMHNDWVRSVLVQYLSARAGRQESKEAVASQYEILKAKYGYLGGT